AAAAAADNGAIDADQNLSLAVIIDCSDVGHTIWNRSLILTRQAISLLKAGDELIIITAHEDKNVIETICRIDPGSPAQRTRLNQKLMSLKYKWWCHANIADALQFAFSELDSRPYTSKYCLVISDGCYGDWEVNNIRHKAAVCKLGGVKLLMAVAETANQDIFLAGDRGEFDTAIIEKSDIAGWFEKFRPHQIATKQTIVSKIQTPLPAFPKGKKLDAIKGPDQTNFTKPPVPVGTHKKRTLGKPINYILVFIIVAVAVVCLLFVIKIAMPYRTAKLREPEAKIKPKTIIAECDGIQYDFGPENTITNSIIGTSYASIIPLNDSSIEEEHIRLFRKLGKLHIKNLASVPITVNNLSLNSGSKEQLLLPARIQLSDTVRIGLFEIELENNTISQEDNYEN
ncbi:MAG: hypothetical protein H8D47_04420, partial [Planctomycetes bacterium]|nr:hypothetical protein [Planctomycetota bacterium]